MEAMEEQWKGRYVAGLGLCTWGADGEGLGSDEAEVVALSWTVLDRHTSSVVSAHTKIVQPRELAKVDWESAAAKAGVSEADVRAAPFLHEALAEWEGVVSSLDGLAEGSQGPDGPQLCLLTDGQLPLRQVLHPEAAKKDISLPGHYWTFFDVRKEFRRLAGEAGAEGLGTLADAMVALGVQSEPAAVAEAGAPAAAPTEPKAARDSRHLVTVASLLIARAQAAGAAAFAAPDRVQSRLLAGVCGRDSDVDENCIVRARGLPWQSSDQDVADFFSGLNIAKGGVALCLSSAGRRNGEALVRFEEAAQRDMALRRHRHFMGNRYIEIYRASAQDFLSVAAGDNDEVQKFLAKEAPVIIRMRGLPYDATPQQIIEFFQREDGERVEVVDGEEGILFVSRADGRATGDAFVLLRSDEDALKATNRQKQYIGTRYIELFRTTTAEVQQVINNSMESSKGSEGAGTPGLVGGGGLVGPGGVGPGGLAGGLAGGLGNGGLAAAAAAQMAAQSLVPQQLLIQGRSRDCIRLRGLPYEAQVQHILDFLGEWASHIVYQGVHMVFNAQGQASGEAFIQMDAETAAHSCAEERHNKYMQIGKKQRYIEVFQCSADDMNLVLTGPGSSAAAAGMGGAGAMGPGGPFPMSPTGPGAQFGAQGQLAQLAFANPAMAHALLQAQHSNLLQAQLLASQRLVVPVSGMGPGGQALHSPSNPASPLGPFSPVHAQHLLLAQNQALLHQGHPHNGLVSPTSAQLPISQAGQPHHHHRLPGLPNGLPNGLPHPHQHHPNSNPGLEWFNSQQQQPAPLL